MTDRIRIKQYEQAADEKVSIGGIKWVRKWDVCIQCDSAEEAERVRTRLAQPEPEPVATLFGSLPVYDVPSKQEPVAWMRSDKGHIDFHKHPDYIPLYTAPPQREFTEIELMEMRPGPIQIVRRARLTQPEPDPVGWIYEDDEGRMMFTQMPHPDPLWEPVYRAKKKWQGLTDEEVERLIPGYVGDASGVDLYWLITEIEAKLKAKNDS